MVDEVAREGNRALAEFLGKSLRSTCRLVKEMKSIGVVFGMVKGKPPRLVNMWFPTSVVRYMAARQRELNEEKSREYKKS